MKAQFLASTLTFATLSAQLVAPTQSAADQKITDAQANEVFAALRAVNFQAKEVVYPIYAGRQRVAYGVSIGEGRLLTKASEVMDKRVIFTANREQVALAAKVTGIYPEHDLAVLEVPGLTAPAAVWTDASDLEEGAFLTAIRTDGEAQSMGVLSVRERSLRSIDQGFLGIQMDPAGAGNGVRVENVVQGSAAAAAGIRRGDVITMISGEKVRGFYELSTKLRRLKNGEQPEIELLRGQRALTVQPTLKGREIDEQESGRINRMDRMSGKQSRVRGNFGNVLQSDMELEVTDAGLPVVDLKGRIVGLVIARAGRISTLILPGDDIAKALQVAPQPFVPEPTTARRGGNWPEDGRKTRMRRELEAMRRMMENLQRDLDGE